MNYMNSVYVNVLLIILNVFCTSNHKTVQNLAAFCACFKNLFLIAAYSGQELPT